MDVVSDHVHGHGLAICANGAAVVDLHGGPGAHRFVKVRALARDIALDVVRLLRDAAPGTVVRGRADHGIHYEPDYPAVPHGDPGATVAPAEKLLARGGARTPTSRCSRCSPTTPS